MQIPGLNERDLRKFAAAIGLLAIGRTNACGQVTLTANTTTTTVSKVPFVNASSKIFLTPRTANAAGALATTYRATTDTASGSFTLTHANAATVDRTFDWVAVGG